MGKKVEQACIFVRSRARVQQRRCTITLPPARGCSAGTAAGRWLPTPPAHADGLGDHAGTFLGHQQQV